MGKEYKTIFLKNSLEYLSLFEKKTSLLYEDLAEKLESPLTKALVQSIALDGTKHAITLKGMARTIAKNTSKPMDLPRAMKETWSKIDKFQVELSKIDMVTKDELADVCTQLTIIETSLAAQYDDLLNFDILESLCEELNREHKISFESIKMLLLNAHNDEEHHKALLAIVAEFPCVEVPKVDNTPAVSFRNPDAWSRPG
jgi:hypothetical protein